MAPRSRRTPRKRRTRKVRRLMRVMRVSRVSRVRSTGKMMRCRRRVGRRRRAVWLLMYVQLLIILVDRAVLISHNNSS